MSFNSRKKEERVIDGLRASAKKRIKFSICSPFAEERERNGQTDRNYQEVIKLCTLDFHVNSQRIL